MQYVIHIFNVSTTVTTNDTSKQEDTHIEMNVKQRGPYKRYPIFTA